jgi:hypothetical protein
VSVCALDGTAADGKVVLAEEPVLHALRVVPVLAHEIVERLEALGAFLEQLCRYGARGPVAESRLRRLEDGRYEFSPKKGTAFTLTAAALVRRLVALLPPARLHLTSFHRGYAPNASLRPLVTQPPPKPQAPAPAPAQAPHLVRSRMQHLTRGARSACSTNRIASA